jgi:hypothetical protein
VVVVRRLAFGLLCLIARLVQLLVLATYIAMAAVAALVMGVIGLVILALLAAEAKGDSAAPAPSCARSRAEAGLPWSRGVELR